jgi:hypothetical protein
MRTVMTNGHCATHELWDRPPGLSGGAGLSTDRLTREETNTDVH